MLYPEPGTGTPPETGVVAGQAPVPSPQVQVGYRGVQGASGPDLYPGRGCVRSTPPGTGPGTGYRIVPGRHRDTCPGGTCEGCQPCPRSHCRTCRRTHAVMTCPHCLELARLNLAMVVELLDRLPLQARHGRQAYHPHHDIPGGDATVMLVPASTSWEPGQLRTVYADPGDPRPPLDVLASWSNRWHAEAGTRPGPVTVERVTEHLNDQLHHIAGTQLFVHLTKDLAAVLHQLENVLYAGERPEVSRVPCLSCHTRLHKQWATKPHDDHWSCPVCGEVYDQRRYDRAQHAQLASRGADRYVPLTDAAAVTGRSEDTIRSWVRDGLVESRREPGRRREVWWPDVRERNIATPFRRRRRP